MHLTPMRFTTIEGTEVTVKVNSPQEAKSAIKELRHRKKEVALHKRALQRQEKLALKERAQMERARRGGRGLFGALSRAARMFRKESPHYDLNAVESELHVADEMMHNIDVCIVQIEGKLLSHR